MDLRPYQSTLAAKVQTSWAEGARNVVMRLATGGGKTIILAWLIMMWVQQARGAVAVIAHRHELVSQLSHTLAAHGIRHNIIAAETTRRAIIAGHIAEFGRSFYDPGSQVAVASVDTLVRVDASWFTAWCAQVTLWVTDEGHHVVRDNKWHTSIGKFTNPAIHGLLPTATPGRADGKGLGAHADGVAHAMVEGPPERSLIEDGYLNDYRIVCPETDYQMYGEVGASGDYSSKQLKEASQRSHIIGDVVQAYKQWAWGKIGITFTTDVETATKMAAAYRAAGIPSEVLTGATEAGYRRQILKRLAKRELWKVVAVDVISEGTDIPAIEVITGARISHSYPLFAQQFGRGLRPMYAPGYDLSTKAGRLAAIANGPKPKALYIDLAGNTLRHQGPPDKPRAWSLDRREGKSAGDGIPLRTCGAGHTEASRAEHLPKTPCHQPFERFNTECPYCGFPLPKPVVGAGRPAIEAVDGDLAELDPETLAALRGDVQRADISREEYAEWLRKTGVNDVVYRSGLARHRERAEARATLRAVMAEWAGARLREGKTDRQVHKLFALSFGCDVLTAQTLGRSELEKLTEKVRAA